MKLLSLSALLLCLVSISLHAQPYQRVTTINIAASEVNGTWTNGRNTFKIVMLSDGRLQLDFDGTYSYRTPRGERMANIGTFASFATLSGNTATVRNVNESEECSITLLFTGGKMKVVQEGLCGFGNGVTADGTYKRTSRKVPKLAPIETVESAR